MLFKKENGFSLVEVMILFVVMSAILAASIATISRRSNNVPIKIARGAYICYMDDDGNLHEELFNRKQKISERMLEPDEKCVFKPVKQAAAYQLTVIGAGASGYNYSKLTNTTPNAISYFKMAEGFSGYGFSEYGELTPWESMAENADGSTVGQVTDNDLWSFYKGEDLTVTAHAPDGQKGDDITACFYDPNHCACFEKDKNKQLDRPYYAEYGKWGISLASTDEIYKSLVYDESENASNMVEKKYMPNPGGEGTTLVYYYQGIQTNQFDVTKFNQGENSAPVPNQRGVCEGTDDLKSPLSWGGEWYCQCKNETAEGQDGGKGGYITHTTNLSEDSLVNYYTLDGSDKQYQNVLKKFADNMQVGICDDSTDYAECTFTVAQLPTAKSNSSINVGTKSNKKTYCDSENCEAPNGSDVESRVAIMFPDYSYSAIANGFSIDYQDTVAKGGNGAIVEKDPEAATMRDASGAGADRWRKLDYSARKGINGREGYKEVKDAVGVVESADPSYRPMIEFDSKLVHRNYTYGQPGANGSVTVRTKITIKDDCKITIGRTGNVHTGQYSKEYRDYVDSNIGTTVMSCERDGYKVEAAGGMPSIGSNTHEYWYKHKDKDLEFYEVKKGAINAYEQPIALSLLINRGLGLIEFGKGGNGVTMKDKCIKPKGTFTITKYNEYDHSNSTTITTQDYDDPKCYNDSNDYGTVMQDLEKNADGSFKSKYLDVYPAEKGKNGAVIVTW